MRERIIVLAVAPGPAALVIGRLSAARRAWRLAGREHLVHVRLRPVVPTKVEEGPIRAPKGALMAFVRGLRGNQVAAHLWSWAGDAVANTLAASGNIKVEAGGVSW